jgi:transposase
LHHVKSLPAHAVRALITARKKLVGQRVTLENQIRGLAVVFGVRLPRGLSPAFTEQVIGGSEGVAGLSGAVCGLLAARNAVLEAITAIDRDMKRLARASEACRRLMTIPGVGQLTALALVAAIDDLERFRRSRDVGAGRSTMRKARIALACRLAIIMHAMLRHGTEFKAA